MKTHKPRATVTVVGTLLLIVGLTLAGCDGGGGACVVKSWMGSYCCDDMDADECEGQRSGSFEPTLYPDSSCADHNYVKSCPGTPCNYKPRFSCP